MAWHEAVCIGWTAWYGMVLAWHGIGWLVARLYAG